MQQTAEGANKMKSKTLAISIGLAAAVVMLLGTVSSLSLPREDRKRAERIEWVAKCMMQMQAVKVGMTRKEVEKILTTEGGLSSPGWNHYVSRECPFFKVDVEFKYQRDKDGRGIYGQNDPITKISRPYLEMTTFD
jgi:hypothetical protein